MQQCGQLEKQSTRAFLRTLVTLVVPIALQNLINVAVQSADVIMLGRVNETVLSAGSLAGQVQFVLILIFFGLASGAAVLTAQYWGKGDTRTIEKVMTIALRLAMGVAILFFLAAMLIPATLMRIFTPDPEVIAYGVQYLRFIAPSYLLVAFTNTYLNIIRSVEIVIVSTIVYFISLIINIFLNAILIFGSLGFPAMGIRGAALATTLARVVEFCIVAAYAACNKVLRLRIKDFLSWNAQLFKDFMRYAMPTTLNEMLWGLAMSANAVIVGHLGSQAVAANSVAQVMRQLATVVSFGLASATAIMVGKAIGAGDELLARHNASRLLKISALAGVAGSGIILLARPFVASMMNLSPLADKYLRFLLIVMSIYVLCQAFTGCMIIGVLRGGGDTRFGLFLDTGTMWGFSIIFAALAAFVFHWPVKVVFAIIMCDELIKLPIAFARYKGGCWLRNVTR